MVVGRQRRRNAGRIVVFGATGYTGRLVAERLAVQASGPVLAGRSRGAAGAGRTTSAAWRWRHGRRDAPQLGVRAGRARATCSSPPSARSPSGASRPCARRSRPAAPTSTRPASRRSSGACSTSSGRPPKRAGAPLLTAMGYDFVPGALAGALALEEAGEDAVRVDVGYYALGMDRERSAGHARVAGRRHARRRATRSATASCRPCGPAERVRVVHGRGQGARRRSRSAAPSTSRCRPSYPRLREVNVYLGWFGPLARPMQAGALVGSVAMRVPGVRGGAAGRAASGCAALVERARGRHDARRRVVDRRRGVRRAAAAARRGAPLGRRPYAFTAAFLAWAARAAAGGRIKGTGALGPVAGVRARGARARLRRRRAQPRRRLSQPAETHQRCRQRPGRLERRRPPSSAAAARGGRWNSFQRSGRAPCAGPNAAGSRSGQTWHPGAVDPVAARIALTARRAASLAPSIVARSVFVRT